MSNHPEGLFLIGPLTITILLASLAVTTLVFGAAGRLYTLAEMSEQAAWRLARRSGLLPAWGLAALLLILTLAIVLFKIRALALLGLIVLLSGVALLGLGLGVAAIRVGGALDAALGAGEGAPLKAMGLGSIALFFAAIIPVVGWITAGAVILSGLGAVLETMLSRDGAA